MKATLLPSAHLPSTKQRALSMKKSIFYLLLSISVLLVTSCSHSDDAQIEGPRTKGTVGLQGSWNWVASTGSIAGVTITPESSGRTMEVEFTHDAVFNKFVNGKKVYTSPYALREKDSIVQYTTFALFESIGLGFDHQVEQQFKLEGSGTLWLIDPCCDNFTFEFQRKP